MAKKKTTGKKKKRSSSSKGGLKDIINFNELIGMAGGSFADKKGIDTLIPEDWDPKMKAGAKIFGIGWLMKQDFVKNLIKDEGMRNGAKAAIQVHGVDELMEEFNIAGMGDDADDAELAVVIEGVEDVDTDDDDMGGDDDLDVVNEDVLGDDDDLDVVNEDVLGLDDED